MTNENFQLLKLISAIGNLDDNTMRIEFYELNKRRLQDYSMIFVDEIFGMDKTAYLNKIVDLDFDYNSLFASNKILCVNKKVLDNKDKWKDTVFKNQVCIAFDLNIISQLKYCNENKTQDLELNKIINLCKSGGCAFDDMNFVIENFMKDKNNISLDSYAIEDIREYEKMFPYKRFSYDRGMSIDKRMEMLLKIYNDEKFKETVEFFYKDIYLMEYAYLLAIIYIHFKYSKLSPKHKFEKFLDFCNEFILAFHPCSCNLAKIFYDNPELRFFKKIQKNNKKIIETIENMSWDIFHLRFLEQSVRFSHEDTEILMIPIFISKDKGLN